jgi:hypothetical protein
LRQVIASRRGARPGAIPKLAPLALHGDAGGIGDLDPDATWTGSIGAVDLLRNDTFGAKPAGMREDDRPDGQTRYCTIAAPARPCGRGMEHAHIRTLMLDEVEA